MVYTYNVLYGNDKLRSCWKLMAVNSQIFFFCFFFLTCLCCYMINIGHLKKSSDLKITNFTKTPISNIVRIMWNCSSTSISSYWLCYCSILILTSKTKFMMVGHLRTSSPVTYRAHPLFLPHIPSSMAQLFSQASHSASSSSGSS